MNRFQVSILTALGACLLMSATAATAQTTSGAGQGSWLAAVAAAEAETQPADEHHDHEHDADGRPSAADCKCVPLPFHCIEGYSGGAITPLAYLCNYCNCGCGGKHLTYPTVSYSYMNISTKHLHTFAITQSFYNRIEFGYAVNHLTIGSLYDDIKKVGMDTVRDDVYLHHFNVRAKLIEENDFGLPLPAVTAGVHFKYNHGVDQMNRRVNKAFTAIGYDKNCGTDFTLTMTKMFPKLLCGRPVILTGGLRLSKASQLGLLGFGHSYRATFEGSVVALPTDWLVVGYEFRQKKNPYREIPGLVESEDNWHALSASVIVNKHLTISALAGFCGHIANANADTTWGLQIRYEF